jgi:hypothetical protein
MNNSCPTDQVKPPVKNPSTQDTIRRFVRTQHKEAWVEAKSAPDASPWRLVQLGGIKHVEKAFVIARDLLIEQIFSMLLDVSVSDKQREELFNSVVARVDARIDELMQKPRPELENNDVSETTQQTDVAFRV